VGSIIIAISVFLFDNSFFNNFPPSFGLISGSLILLGSMILMADITMEDYGYGSKSNSLRKFSFILLIAGWISSITFLISMALFLIFPNTF